MGGFDLPELRRSLSPFFVVGRRFLQAGAGGGPAHLSQRFDDAPAEVLLLLPPRIRVQGHLADVLRVLLLHRRRRRRRFAENLPVKRRRALPAGAAETTRRRSGRRRPGRRCPALPHYGGPAGDELEKDRASRLLLLRRRRRLLRRVTIVVPRRHAGGGSLGSPDDGGDGRVGLLRGGRRRR